MIAESKMATIYDRNKSVNKPADVRLKSDDVGENIQGDCGLLENMVAKGIDAASSTESSELKNEQEMQAYVSAANNALGMVDDIVLKSYLSNLSEMEVMKISFNDDDNNVILFKINRMAYEKDEYATDKFVSTISAMTFTNSSLFLIVDGKKDHTDFYLGVRNNDDNRTTRSVADAFYNSINGQFPGIILEDLSKIEKGSSSSLQDSLSYRFNKAASLSSCVGVPAYKSEKGNYTNINYIQGIEKLAIAMQGKEYTAIILASNITSEEIRNIRLGYESIYTQLSSIATQQLAYSTNESLANAISRTKSLTDSITDSETHGSGITNTTGENFGKAISKSTSKGESKQNAWSKGGQLAGSLVMAGSVLTATGVGAPAGLVLMGAGAIASLGGIVFGKTKSSSESESKSETEGHFTSIGSSETDNYTKGRSHTEGLSDTRGNTSTIGSSKNFTLTVHNKHIEEVLKRIDKQLQRIELSESTGLWSASAYFFSYDNDRATAETGATIFRSIMQGEGSGIETSALNTWFTQNDEKYQERFNNIKASVVNFIHPIFLYAKDNINTTVEVPGTSLVSSKELALMLGLPRKSVPGLPVIEHVSLAKEVVRHNVRPSKNPIEIGCIFDQGISHFENKVKLDAKSLTQHTFITGSTGCGKSETIYKLIDEAAKVGATFLIIEPAKGEYKNIFGNINVFGTNPLITKLLRINPFRFPKGIHVLEHIDRLIEIFNVCWPMYAAMPAVPKKSMLTAYENCGWNLIKSSNLYSDHLFPTFVDLLNELVLTINNSAYSEEVKSNYTGSLVTRIESLTNGINGEIFSADEIPDKIIFDENTIIDLSRVGSQETKSLIMGILIMRLSEYRMSYVMEANSKLRHITIIEEAHNILKRTSTEQSMEGSNITGKSVEMLTNAIAEMRTYGEGFVIVDQSPTSVDPAAIKNTNTKIIMRLPDADDRRIAGKAAGMKDNQIDEIAKLPTGIAVVYQNDWIDPVLCQIDLFNGERFVFTPTNCITNWNEADIATTEILKLLLKGRLSNSVEPDLDLINQSIDNIKRSTSTKIVLRELVSQYNLNDISLWKDENFGELSKIVTDILGVKMDVERLVHKAKDFSQLNEELSKLITEHLEIPSYMDLAIRQSLMKDYSEGSDTKHKIYNAWFQEINKQILE